MAGQNIIKVPYTSLGGKYSPYLELIFANSGSLTVSSRTFALLDTGADHTVIPYSLGNRLQLQPPSSQAELKSVSGVAGQTTYLERNCEIYIIDNQNGKLYMFNEKVWWIHPNLEAQQKLADLAQRFTSLDTLKDQCKAGTTLEKYFEDEKDQVAKAYGDLNGFYETDVLIGRPFLDNFDFVQFVHKDRTQEHKNFFNYRLSKKVSNILNMPSATAVAAPVPTAPPSNKQPK